MSEMCTVKETAQRWNIPEERVTHYCRKKRIDGAQKVHGVWMIPADSVKPCDMRGRRAPVAVVPAIPRKPMPIGVSNYRDACTNYYYVDKTLMIKEFWDERPKVSCAADENRPIPNWHRAVSVEGEKTLEFICWVS